MDYGIPPSSDGGHINGVDIELIKKYTGKFQALWDQYFWLRESHERRKNTIGLESTPEGNI